MNDMKKNIRRVFWLYFILFATVVAYLGKFIFLDSAALVINSYNPRLKTVNKEIVRGDIYDAKENVLATSVKTVDGYSREYPYGKIAAHTVGYVNMGRAGVEAAYNFQLQKPDKEIWQRLSHVFTGENIVGDSVVLTLDLDLQNLAYEQLGKKRGAILIMEPSTGKILASVSYPNYDPNTIAENWAALNEEDNGALVNRVSQGLYPPGSVFKIVTALGAMEYLPDYQSFQYNCTGEATFGSNRIRCFDSTVHGKVDMAKAFAVSCNSFFATMGNEIGPGNMAVLANRLRFNSPLYYHLAYNQSQFKLKEGAGQSEVIETAIGQGRTMVSPLHLAMLASAVANGGIMMEPYVMDHLQTYAGKEKGKVLPKMLGQVMKAEEAECLTGLMVDVVTSGTAVKAAVPGISMAAKTGTAENPLGKDHGLIVGFAPVEKPEIVFCIVLENCGGSGSTLPIAKKLVKYYFDNQ